MRKAPSELPSLSSAAKLRQLLKELEAELGLFDLTEAERDVLYAARIASRPESDGTQVFASENLREHGFVDEIAPATFYRALKALRDRGFIRLAPGHRKNHYVLEFDPAAREIEFGARPSPQEA
ncbi:MAG: hypothetical protein ACO3WM_05320 [Gemmobacter sp.]